jgi:hypothetical protein
MSSKAQECLAKAERDERYAEKADVPQVKETLKEFAATWRQLAREFESSEQEGTRQ